MNKLAATAMHWAERGLIPDTLVRAGIRSLLKERLSSLPLGSRDAIQAAKEQFVADMDRSPIALVPDKANEQHYEVPAAFFAEVLGPRRKYSACHWSDRTGSLDEAEVDALAETCRRADLQEGMRILEWDAAGARSASGRRSTFRGATSWPYPTPDRSANTSNRRRSVVLSATFG